MKLNSPQSPERTRSIRSRYNGTSFIPLSRFLWEAQKCMLSSRGDACSWGWQPHAVGSNTFLHLFQRESHMPFWDVWMGNFKIPFKATLQAPQLCINPQRVFSCQAWSLSAGVGNQVPYPVCVHMYTCVRVCTCVGL